MSFRHFVLLLLLHTVVDLAGAQAEEGPRPATIIVFGASTSAPRGELVNYARLLEKELPDYGIQPQIFNSAVPGNTTVAARARFERDVLRHRSDLVVILLGANDSFVDVWKSPPATASRVPAETTAENLRYFVRELRKQSSLPVLMTLNPMRWTDKLKEMYGKAPYHPDDEMGLNPMLIKYNEVIRTVAKEEQVPLVDLYPAFLAYGDDPRHSLDDLYSDGMHPNEKGHRIIGDRLIPVVAGLLKPFKHVGNPAAADPEGLHLLPAARPLPGKLIGPFVRLKDGGILTVDGMSAVISRDDGKSWQPPTPMFPQGNVRISDERAILVTQRGTIVAAFMNLATRSKENWNSRTLDFVPEIRCDVWSTRSTDGGKTWTDAGIIQSGYAGATRGLVQAANGNLVLTTQNVARTPARHITTVYYSADDGKTWQPSICVDAAGRKHPHFDIGGHGHHDGAIEPTVELLGDGRLWMLIRTGHDAFWQAFSADHGVTWTGFGKTEIDASAAPGLLKRLASGRLLLVWNRLYPEGKTEYERRGPQWHARPASYHREELSAALSGDDGKTWSRPVVLARKPGAWLSYPYVFEHTPGELWLTTMQGGVRMQIREADLLPAGDGVR